MKLYFHLLRTYLIHMMVSEAQTHGTTFKVKYYFYLRKQSFHWAMASHRAPPVTRAQQCGVLGALRGISILETLRATHTCSKARSFIGEDRSTPSPIRLSSRKNSTKPKFYLGKGEMFKMFWCDDILAVQRYATFLRDEY